MEGIQIRSATSADIDVLVKLRVAFLLEFFGNSHGDQDLAPVMRQYFSESIPAGECVAYLAEATGNVVATGMLAFFRFPPSHRVPTGRDAYVFNMYTDPDFRGRGIATKILDRLIADAQSAGCRRVTLHAAEKARPLYTRAGFEAMDSEMRLIIGKR